MGNVAIKGHEVLNWTKREVVTGRREGGCTPSFRGRRTYDKFEVFGCLFVKVVCLQSVPGNFLHSATVTLNWVPSFSCAFFGIPKYLIVSCRHRSEYPTHVEILVSGDGRKDLVLTTKLSLTSVCLGKR